MKLKFIISMVKTDLTDSIVDGAKAAGATGATIINARGVGIHEAKSFFGLTLEAPTDVVLFIVEESLVGPILKAISKEGKFHEPGTGIAFVLPLEQAIGLESQLKSMEDASEGKQYSGTPKEGEGN